MNDPEKIDKLQKLDIDAYAQELERESVGDKRDTLRAICEELVVRLAYRPMILGVMFFAVSV